MVEKIVESCNEAALTLDNLTNQISIALFRPEKVGSVCSNICVLLLRKLDPKYTKDIKYTIPLTLRRTLCQEMQKTKSVEIYVGYDKNII